MFVLSCSFTGTICWDYYDGNGYSTAIDQLNVGSTAAQAVAHELGHNLNLRHDNEQGSTAELCDLGYIMSPEVHNYGSYFMVFRISPPYI